MLRQLMLMYIFRVQVATVNVQMVAETLICLSGSENLASLWDRLTLETGHFFCPVYPNYIYQRS